MQASDKPLLIAISVTSIQNEPYLGPDMRLAQSANIRGESETANLRFSLKSGLLNPEQVKHCELLKQHGFTVVEVPRDWRYNDNGGDGWKDTVIKQAMERVAALYEVNNGVERMAGYDAKLALAILVELNKLFPQAVTNIQLKHLLAAEPSDTDLMSALEALQIDGLISGKALQDHTSGQHRLLVMANIKITGEGRKHLSDRDKPIKLDRAIIHGDQIINYGHAGAIGRNSLGTINYQTERKALAEEFDLSQITIELQTLKAEMMKTAKTPVDFQQLSLVAEAEQYAEQQDGAKVLEVLSKSGKWLFDFATHVGTDITAKLVAKTIGLEP